jgi:hypothetical protein
VGDSLEQKKPQINGAFIAVAQHADLLIYRQVTPNANPPSTSTT